MLAYKRFKLGKFSNEFALIKFKAFPLRSLKNQTV